VHQLLQTHTQAKGAAALAAAAAVSCQVTHHHHLPGSGEYVMVLYQHS